MGNSNMLISFSLFFFFISLASSSYFNATHKCSPQQTLDLLLFKESLSSITHSYDDFICQYQLGSDYHPMMMKWDKNTDCCKWDGVTCNHFTGDVIGIDLSCGMLKGTIHPNTTLFHLPHLQTLNLAYNDFYPSQIPHDILKFSDSLTLLNISKCGFVGSLPKSLVNLRHLTTLVLEGNNLNGTLPSFLFALPLLENIDLRDNMFSGSLPAEVFNCRSLKRLFLGHNQFDGEINGNFTPQSFINLTHLDLSNNYFIGVWKLDTLLSSLPNLQSLHLSYSGLSIVSGNSSSYVNPDFQELGLSSCNLTSFPPSICNMRSLEILYISNNRVSGVIPQCLGNITSSLRYLSLSSNQFQGPLPPSICNMRSLEDLDVSNNRFSGVIPQCLGNITSSLRYLYLSYNRFQGSLPPSICNMRSLEDLDVTNNRFSGVIPQCLGNISSTLDSLDLGSNQFQGPFPPSVCNLRNLLFLDIYDNRFSGVIPQCLGNITSHLQDLNVGYNQFQGPLPPSICNMRNLYSLDISSNSLSGVVPQCLGNITSLLHSLQLSLNQFQGPLPPSICNMRNLAWLDISNNRFSGVIPECVGNITSFLYKLDMGNNHFHGSIPDVYGDCGRLDELILNGNELQGEVPSSLSKCRYLKVLDLGNNQLNGRFLGWLGDLPLLQVLVLKSNKLHGHIETYHGIKGPFPSMKVLDISHNGFEGLLPVKYFQNFNSMKAVETKGSEPHYLNIYGAYYSFTTVLKGVEQEFPKLFVGYMIIDLSNNKFEGEIPGIIGCLASLIVLDLSNNSLTGHIPNALGNLSQIESLDLSWNQLTGHIPESLADLDNLGFLNLSQNHLVGRIPEGTQFSTFFTSFGGNPGLCGLPLLKKCEHPQQPQLEDDGDEDEDGEWGFTWKVVMMGYGCGTIIGLVMGYVMLSTRKPKWFNAIADAGERIIQTRQNRTRYVFIGK